MKTVKLDRFTKSILVLFVAGFVAGCGSEPEGTAGQSQDTEVITEEFAPRDDEVATNPESAEAVEETLESILERADEIIQRTESSISALKSQTDAGLEPGETVADSAGKSESVLAAGPDGNQATQVFVDDGLEVVKTTPDLVRKVQQALTEAGFNPGAADGKLGPRTLGALTDFQQRHGLAAGKLTKETLRELGILF